LDSYKSAISLIRIEKPFSILKSSSHSYAAALIQAFVR